MSWRGGKWKKSNLEPRAYLRKVQNVLPGVRSRTAVIRTLRDEWKSARKVSNESGLSYKVAIYHLHLMEDEGIVSHKSARPRLWRMTGLGQQRIIESDSQRERNI